MRLRKSLLLFISFLVFVTLACNQSGDILTPEEATARAQEGIFRPSGGGESAVDAEFAVGGSANVIGSSFLINILDTPGGRIVGSQGRGSTVEILASAEFEGEIWYQVDSGIGNGWIKVENLEPIEGESGDEGEAESEVETTTSGPAVGDTVYLISNGFLINLLREPNGNIVAVQERGVVVTILDLFEADDGTLWYLIDAPTGEGWVPAENISVEVP